jgi:hypothetical protein
VYHLNSKGGKKTRRTNARHRFHVWPRGQQLDALQKDDPEGYVHWTKIYEGKGHWLDRQDAAALPWMAQHTRNPLPSLDLQRRDRRDAAQQDGVKQKMGSDPFSVF